MYIRLHTSDSTYYSFMFVIVNSSPPILINADRGYLHSATHAMINNNLFQQFSSLKLKADQCKVTVFSLCWNRTIILMKYPYKVKKKKYILRCTSAWAS